MERRMKKMADKKTSKLGALGGWLLCFAAVWYFLGWTWAIGLGFVGIIFEASGYVAWIAGAIEEADQKRIRRIPEDKLAKIEEQDLVVSITPRRTQTISLRNIVAARLGEETRDYVGLILTDSAGESRQHFIQTVHPGRGKILPLVQDHVRHSTANA